MDNKCFFTNVTDMADFCAQLMTKGIAFYTSPRNDGYEVVITGY